MPPRPAPTARSSSRSSKRSEPPLPAGDPVVAVGEVVAAHALRGMLRVRPYQPPAPSLSAGARALNEHGGFRREITVRSATPHGRARLLVALDGVTDRTTAEGLVGARLLVLIADLPPADDAEFYYHEVVGFAVATTDGETLGTVAETFSTGLNDVWVVRGGRREYLIPVIAAAVRTLHRPARRLVIDPLPR